MFINKTTDGRNNLCGKNVAVYRKNLGISQRVLADLLQINGLDIDKNAVQRIESGQRFVTDIELKALAIVFQKSVDAMLETGV
ncbi:MAG: helix-turn-helix transcriptional regulator [Clostridiales bacterium]|nr:helix-turn-helix transcriptional regulator [Clostridiales bacterium]